MAAWRSGPFMRGINKPRPASSLASAQSELALGLMFEEQMMTGKWPTLWKRNRSVLYLIVLLTNFFMFYES